MNAQHLPGLAAGISPERALACTELGCILRNAAACFRLSVSIIPDLFTLASMRCDREKYAKRTIGMHLKVCVKVINQN